MIIKYKGHTSKLLSDLSLQLGNTVDLKTSEKILVGFFMNVLKEASADKKILIVSCLPSYIKPFCQIYCEDESAIVQQKTYLAVLKVLEKHVPEEKLLDICACFQENRFREEVKKEASMAA